MARRISLTIIVLLILSFTVPLSLVHAQTATVQIIPSTTTVETGETFTVNLTITDVSNLAVWEFRLFYLNSILNCINASEGLFLDEGGNPQSFLVNITNSYNATYGMILFGSTILGAVPGVNGSGTLASVTLQAISSGDTPLQFDNDPTWNFLLDGTPPPRNPISYTTVDGAVQVATASQGIVVANVTSYKTIINQGYCGNITVTTENFGTSTETFNLTVYANTSFVASENVSLSSGNLTNVTFTWNTTGFEYGNYTLTAYATPVPGETDTANSNCTGGWVFVSLVGDVTGPNGVPDGKVDIRDVHYIAMYYGTTPSSPNWNANADINNDGKVDIRDVHIAAENYGKSVTY